MSDETSSKLRPAEAGDAPSGDVVLVGRAGATRIITMNRPEARNALTRAVLAGVRAALDSASSDAAIRCVILTGAAGHFCSPIAAAPFS